MHKFAKFAALSSLATLGSGCAGNIPTLIEKSSLCRHWTVQKVRKGDALSPKSAAEALARNESRVTYGCKKLENEAA